MENINLIDSFAEFKEFKNIDRATLMRVLEDIFRNMLLKRYGTDENFDIIINIDKGDLEIWRNRTVVEDDKLENPNSEITLTEAKKIDEDYELGEEVTDEVKFKDFGRRSVLALRQNLSAVFWNWRKTMFTINIRIKSDKSFWVKSIRYGKKKCWSWMTKAMN